MLTRIVLSTAAVAAAAESPSLMLLQHTVEMKVLKDESTGMGSSAPVSEAGYQLVASMNNDEEMGIFIARVASAEARTITDAGSLAGLVPYYSGRLGVQNIDTLKKELRAAPWVGDGLGRAAPLDEDGYQSVAGMGDEAHMMAFSRRILDSNGKRSLDESMLKGLIPWFNGQKAVQSFDKLEGELLNATWTEPRVKVELALAEHEDTKSNRTVEAHVVKEDPPEDDDVATTLATTLETTLETTLVTTLETTLVTTLETTLVTTLVTTLPPAEDDSEALLSEGARVDRVESEIESSMEEDAQIEAEQGEVDTSVGEEVQTAVVDSSEGEVEALAGAEVQGDPQDSEKKHPAGDAGDDVVLEKESGDGKEAMSLEKKKALEKKEEEALQKNAQKKEDEHREEKAATDAKENKAPVQEEHREEKAASDAKENKAPAEEEHREEKASTESTEQTHDASKSETSGSEATVNTTASEDKDGEEAKKESAVDSGSAKEAEGSKKKSWFSWFKR